MNLTGVIKHEIITIISWFTMMFKIFIYHFIGKTTCIPTYKTNCPKKPVPILIFSSEDSYWFFVEVFSFNFLNKALIYWDVQYSICVWIWFFEITRFIESLTSINSFLDLYWIFLLKLNIYIRYSKQYKPLMLKLYDYVR